MTRRLPLLVIIALLAFAVGRVTSGVSADVPYAWIALRASAFQAVSVPATPRAEPDSSISLGMRSVQDPIQLGVPQEPGRGHSVQVPVQWRPAGLRATARPTTREGGTPHSLRGIASWGPFSGHVVTRLPRGMPIVVTGPLGTWRGVSWGYGPAAWTGRIADLDRSVFAAICGPPSRGICTVTLRW